MTDRTVIMNGKSYDYLGVYDYSGTLMAVFVDPKTGIVEEEKAEWVKILPTRYTVKVHCYPADLANTPELGDNTEVVSLVPVGSVVYVTVKTRVYP